MISVEEFTDQAAQWLREHGEPKMATDDGDLVWGEGEFSVAVFHALLDNEERTLLEDLKSWNLKKAERGYHAITWPEEYGGLGLTTRHARSFSRLESGYALPARHETFSVTTRLIAPTVDLFGTDEQKERLVAALLSSKVLCCQLFSEPGAGSDLAGLGCRAVRDGAEWVINGQKVWSSGAQFSEWGELIARTDVEAPKHKGMTAFMVPMDTAGIEIRPIRQMSGGTSFNEVYFDEVRIPDTLRLGPEGEGWRVALTTLGFERDHSDSSGGKTRAGGSWHQLLATAQALGVNRDPVIRQKMAGMYIHTRIENLTNRRAADIAKAGGTPGPEGSLGKLLWTEGMKRMSDVVSEILGAALVADNGQWGTYAWGEHVLGAPGYRIAGGTDEVQRNILGERVLGLPGEPRVDKGIPWKDVVR